MVPSWFHILSEGALVLGGGCAAFLAFDEIRRPQAMAVMNLVWPLAALFAGPAVVWLYFADRRAPKMHHSEMHHGAPPNFLSIAKGTLHCGAGCTLGDIAAELLALASPSVALWCGWQTLFAQRIFAIWLLDYLLAFIIGIAFQYFAIVPMRHLTPAQGISAAIKADTLSLTAWQIGMYGFMAFVQFALAPAFFGGELRADMPEFWFAMQLAMLAGFATSYPANTWLIRTGIKHAM